MRSEHGSDAEGPFQTVLPNDAALGQIMEHEKYEESERPQIVFRYLCFGLPQSAGYAAAKKHQEKKCSDKTRAKHDFEITGVGVSRRPANIVFHAGRFQRWSSPKPREAKSPEWNGPYHGTHG